MMNGYGDMEVLKSLLIFIQREIISSIEDFGLLSRSFNKRFLFLKVVLIFDVSDPRLTQKVSCFDE